jgi:hypothetical protein
LDQKNYLVIYTAGQMYSRYVSVGHDGLRMKVFESDGDAGANVEKELRLIWTKANGLCVLKELRKPFLRQPSRQGNCLFIGAARSAGAEERCQYNWYEGSKMHRALPNYNYTPHRGDKSYRAWSFGSGQVAISCRCKEIFDGSMSNRIAVVALSPANEAI